MEEDCPVGCFLFFCDAVCETLEDRHSRLSHFGERRGRQLIKNKLGAVSGRQKWVGKEMFEKQGERTKYEETPMKMSIRKLNVGPSMLTRSIAISRVPLVISKIIFICVNRICVGGYVCNIHQMKKLKRKIL